MKPAIFNTAMVRAILNGRKTNTRRPFTFKKCIRDYVKSMGQDYCLKHQNKLHGEYDWSIRERSGVWADYTHQQFLDEYAPYKVGDIIYVREQMYVNGCLDLYYSADDYLVEFESCDWNYKGEYVGKIPSIHMPKEYARLFLRVKDVRIERLNEISEEDAEKEGCEAQLVPPDGGSHPYYEGFRTLWESIYGNGSFDNRYVWVIEFEQISKEEAMS